MDLTMVILKKHNTFTVPLEKEVKRIDKNGEQIIKTISYRTKILANARFITSSLSNLVNKLADIIHEVKCKTNTVIKNVKIAKLNKILRLLFYKYTRFKDSLIEYRYLC